MGLLELLLPSRCAICAQPGADLCAECRSSLPRLAGPVCGLCGAPTEQLVDRCAECAGRSVSFRRARAALLYTGAVPRLVGAWKERGQRRLGVAAAKLVAEAVPRPYVQALVPVPAQRERSLSRGFHPAAALAVELGKIWELPLIHPLERVGSPRRQRGLPLSERSRNVEGAFRVRRDGVGGVELPTEICLVDDVYTTGATVSACAAALRAAGSARVEAIALARAVRGRR